jgi:acyl-CoA synthetase (AMP-forming)/AMP-acid ligase II
MCFPFEQHAGGENISCAEVESAFFEAHPDVVMECAAFGIKEERLGEVRIRVRGQG